MNQDHNFTNQTNWRLLLQPWGRSPPVRSTWRTAYRRQAHAASPTMSPALRHLWSAQPGTGRPGRKIREENCTENSNAGSHKRVGRWKTGSCEPADLVSGVDVYNAHPELEGAMPRLELNREFLSESQSRGWTHLCRSPDPGKTKRSLPPHKRARVRSDDMEGVWEGSG